MIVKWLKDWNSIFVNPIQSWLSVLWQTYLVFPHIMEIRLDFGIEKKD